MFLAQVQLPTEFFAKESVLTLAGVTGMTYVVSNGIQVAFNWNPRWLALAIAIVLCVFGVAYRGGDALDFVIGVVNGFLVYCTVVGGATLGTIAFHKHEIDSKSHTVRGAEPPRKRGFFSPWFSIT